MSYTCTLQERKCRFHHCEKWLHRHHNGSVNSKRVPSPKGISQVLTSHWLSTSELERTNSRL